MNSGYVFLPAANYLLFNKEIDWRRERTTRYRQPHLPSGSDDKGKLGLGLNEDVTGILGFSLGVNE
jgi:hypothetical protein